MKAPTYHHLMNVQTSDKNQKVRCKNLDNPPMRLEKNLTLIKMLGNTSNLLPIIILDFQPSLHIAVSPHAVTGE